MLSTYSIREIIAAMKADPELWLKLKEGIHETIASRQRLLERLNYPPNTNARHPPTP